MEKKNVNSMLYLNNSSAQLVYQTNKVEMHQWALSLPLFTSWNDIGNSSLPKVHTNTIALQEAF